MFIPGSHVLPLQPVFLLHCLPLAGRKLYLGRGHRKMCTKLGAGASCAGAAGACVGTDSSSGAGADTGAGAGEGAGAST